MPAVSIVMPAYNRAELITTSVLALQAQSCPAWELLVVDDGSTDHTVGLVRNMACGEPRIQVIDRDRSPKGAPTCRNIGVDAAKGEYVIFHDSDDILAPHAVEGRVAALEADSAADAVVSPCLRFEGTVDNDLGLFAGMEPDGGSDLAGFLSGRPPWITISVTWRKSSLIKFGLRWDESLERWQDWFLHVEALLAGASFVRLGPEADCHYRVANQGQSGSQISTSRLSSAGYQALVRKAREVFDSPALSTRLANEGYFKIASFLAGHGRFHDALQLSRGRCSCFMQRKARIRWMLSAHALTRPLVSAGAKVGLWRPDSHSF